MSAHTITFLDGKVVTDKLPSHRTNDLITRIVMLYRFIYIISIVRSCIAFFYNVNNQFVLDWLDAKTGEMSPPDELGAGVTRVSSC